MCFIGRKDFDIIRGVSVLGRGAYENNMRGNLVRMNGELIRNLENKIKRDKIDSCIVQHQDTILFEYFRNQKVRDKKQHKVYSVTKSVLSALIGIAVDKGYLNIDTPISNYFPEFANQEIKIKHLLTMSSGLHYPGNGAMIPTKNWVDFVLSQPVENPPGKKMVYSCGSSQVLSAILQKETGENAEAFAKKHLFAPLGIRDYHWHSDAQGVAIGGYGLMMRPFDMLKFGTLYLHKGRWNSKQIVPSAWVEESTTAHIPADDESSYAYH